ncbi:hypothetical protein N7326_00465 [Corynebacterium sp. ES2794-CONJ1]|uniref:hypothetical protein n=1 Tax=unclassified Corynebacterium TaxID=2624378 RepID=UPI002167C35C|nr:MULTISPECIES: hypothetical protein [unclassified Corynebacterium]MCS4489327.1 hypothetical protein [Corynebacterium sp. ES2775-CONJ]MCS4491140.1 hypothetical protein [Corynebacterium sp. ES2715-CONJ3]MCS4530979.1 hypothetical protein [Corynebacterium sp. ES2730-CONJ]MCU9518346.1 hypothetical protein [Corynebacterium sp. ES2794-CONJ1]
MSKGAPPVSAALRVGGAFIAIAVVLLIFTVMEISQHGWMAPFAVTFRFINTVVAAGLVGGYATTHIKQRPHFTQLIALVGALLLIISGRLFPSTPLIVWEQFWIPSYAVLALICGLYIRRKA